MMSYFCTQKLTLLIILIVNVYSASFSGRPCNTANVKNGKCVKAAECPRFKMILQSGFISADDVKYIQNNKCENMLVCCVEGNTPVVSVTKPRGSTLYLLPNSTDCGLFFGDKITNGDLTGIDEYAFHVLIGYENTKTKEIKYRCGGSLINKRYILTASHCVTPLSPSTKISHIRLGEWFTETNPDCKYIYGERFCADPVVDIPVQKIIPHGQFSVDFNGENDIALIRLAKEVTYTEFIRPICLPISDKLKKTDFTGKKLIAVGYGNVGKFSNSQFKLKVSLPFVSLSECSKKLPRPILKPTHICAGGTEGKDTCQGDSGGPLFNLAEDAYILRGITSAGGTCGGNRPAIYTNVALFTDWILNNLEP